jgi:hypothetical protein
MMALFNVVSSALKAETETQAKGIIGEYAYASLASYATEVPPITDEADEPAELLAA